LTTKEKEGLKERPWHSAQIFIRTTVLQIDSNYMLCEKSGTIALALPGFIAGWQMK